MFIDQDTLCEVNINYAYKGFSKLDTPEIRAKARVIEIAEPAAPADYSDETYYKTSTGDGMPPYRVYTKKSPEQLAALRASKLKQIRDELTENGGCEVGGKWFHTDVKSKQQQMALAMAGVLLPDNLMWKTMDGSFVLMTPTLAGEIFSAQMAREAAIFGICEAKQNDDTPVADGWPARYVEAV